MRLVIGILALGLSGCLTGPGGGSAESIITPPDEVIPALTNVTVKSGDGFECALLESNEIYCRGTNPRISLSPDFELFAAFTSPVLRFETWDDTVCLSLIVAQRPVARDAGLATYCMGEASLGPNYTGYNIIYSGPAYSEATHGSTGTIFFVEPFAGADEPMDVFTNETGNWLVMTDTRSAVTESVEACEVLADSIECDDFTIDLN